MIGLGHAHALSLATSRSFSLPFVGPLDGYVSDLVESYSVYQRLLSGYAGPLFQVRRGSDGAELGIGYGSDGKINTPALLSFCGTGDGWVTRVFGQKNGYDLIQSTAAAQRRIVTGGVLETFADGTPCMRATVVDTQGYYTDTFALHTGTAASLFVIGSITSGSSQRAVMGALVSDTGYDYWSNALGVGQQDSNSRVTAEQNAGPSGLDITFGTKLSCCAAFDGTNITMRADPVSYGAAYSSFAYTAGLSNVQRILAAGCISVGNYYSGSSDGWQGQAVYYDAKAADQLAIMGGLEGV